MDCPKRSAMDGLPEESLVEILARVPARSVYRSKCVAKCWRDLIEDPLNAKKIPRTLQGFFSIDKGVYGCGRGRGRNRAGAAHIGFTRLRASSAPLGIDGCLSFLTKLPGIKIPALADSCNGLLLFEHRPRFASPGLGHIVCNPATKHWVSVPRSPYPRGETSYTYLVFDPVVSFHFHIVQFWFEFKHVVYFDDDDDAYIDDYWELHHQQHDDEEGEEEEPEEVYRISVHVYSSETGTWSHIQNDWEEELGQLEGWRHHSFVPRRGCGCAVLNGVVHFIISDEKGDHEQIVAVDVHGKTQRIIPLPAMAARKPGYVVQSQGHLYYISQASDAHAQLSIWVLEDTQNWVLKHSASLVELFEKRSYSGYNNEYRVVAMHPDGNVVFIVQNQNLISYDMDHKLVNVIATSKKNISAKHIIPYVPCFLESPALTNKH